MSVVESASNRRAVDLIQEILPPWVATSERIGSFAGSTLLAREELAVERAIPKRRSEFAAGRSCAREALARLGVPLTPVLQGKNREPIWPADVVGSITHCEGYCAAAVARCNMARTIGIDAELNERLPPDTANLIVHPKEWDLLRDLPAGPLCWDRLLFSAKESLYKAWFPVERTWLDFEHARISIAPQTGTFMARILRSDAGPDFRDAITGKFVVMRGLILTSIVIPSPAQERERLD